MVFFPFSFVLLLASFLFINGVQYCAKFPGGNDDNILGYFTMKVNHGVASYSFSLDLSSFSDSTTCDLSNGLYYHLHTSWNTEDGRNSGLGSTDCGSTVTGGHYDPNLACSASSEEASGLCTALSRTSTLGYTYNCSSSVYSAGIYGQCEVGDLSGKFGIVYPSSNDRFVQPVAAHTDYQPPTIYNYLKNDNVAKMFSSIVFHCVDSSKTRLICGLLEEMEDDGVCGHSDATATTKVEMKKEASNKLKQQPLPKDNTNNNNKGQPAAEDNQKMFTSNRYSDTANVPSKSPSSGVHKPTWKPSFKPVESANIVRSLTKDPPPGSKGALSPPAMMASRPEAVVDVKHGGIAAVETDLVDESASAAATAQEAEVQAAEAAAKLKEEEEAAEEAAAAAAAEAEKLKEEEDAAAKEAAEKEEAEKKEKEEETAAAAAAAEAEKLKVEAEEEEEAQAEKEAEKAKEKELEEQAEAEAEEVSSRLQIYSLYTFPPSLTLPSTQLWEEEQERNVFDSFWCFHIIH